MLFLPYRTETTPQRVPLVTWVLVIVNVGLFLWTVFIDPVRRDMLFMDYGFVPAEWDRWINFLTCMFLHGGWLHIIGNMLFLFLFGRLVEESLGKIGFVLLYFAAGLLASLAHLFTTPEFLWDVPCIGASGAVSGVLGAAAVVRAREKVRVFYLWVLTLQPLYGKVDLPAILFLGIWFFAQFAYAVSFSEISEAVEVAYWAHVGGFAFGALIGLLTGVGRSFRKTADVWHRNRRHEAVLQALRAGDLDRAQRCLEDVKQHDGLPEEWGLLPARIAFERGASDEVLATAERVFRESLAKRQRKRLLDAYALVTSSGQMPSLTPAEALVLIRALNATGRRAEAMAWLSQALKRESEGPVAGGLFFEWAEAELVAGNRPRAVALFKHVAGSCPDERLAQAARWRANELAGAST